MEDNKQSSLHLPLQDHLLSGNHQHPEDLGYDYDIYTKANTISKMFLYWAYEILKVSIYITEH